MAYVTFVAGTKIKSSEINSNFAATIPKDVATTVSVSHTWSASQIMAGLSSSAPITVSDVTDSASSVTGSVTTAGGMGIAKSLFVGAAIAFASLLNSTTAQATPSALAATQFQAFASTVSGAAIRGYGTTNDVALMNRAGTVVLGVGPNTTVVNIPGTLTVTGLITGSVSGNAATATALQTGRAINGVTFDGTAPITITAAAGTLTGTTLNGTVVTSSLTSVGTLANLTVTATITGSVSGSAATVTTAAQPAITSVGTLTSLSVTGAITAGTFGGVTMSSSAVSGITTLAGTGAVSGFTTATFAGLVKTAYASAAFTIYDTTAVGAGAGGVLNLSSKPDSAVETIAASVQASATNGAGGGTWDLLLRSATAGTLGTRATINAGTFTISSTTTAVQALTATGGSGTANSIIATMGSGANAIGIAVQAAAASANGSQPAFVLLDNAAAKKGAFYLNVASGTNDVVIRTGTIDPVITITQSTGATAFVAGISCTTGTFSGAVSGITTLAGSGAISGFTSLALSAGISGVTTISASGEILATGIGACFRAGSAVSALDSHLFGLAITNKSIGAIGTPTGGGWLYASAGALFWMGPSGTNTQLAAS